MIFRKNAARPTPARDLTGAAFAAIPPRRRVIASWRRDEASGRLKLVWKVLGDIGEKSGS